MAKQLLEINKFQNGTITTPDATDTPEQSASFSLNLDCVNKDGALQGAPINLAVTSKKYTTDGSTATIKFDKCKVIKKVKSDGSTKEDVVAWNDTDNKLHFLEDANNTNPVLDPEGTPFKLLDGLQQDPVELKNVAMEVNNKEVHIGLGNTNKPKWVGYTNHAGIVYNAGKLIIEDAEVKYPSSIPYMHKVVRGGDDGYVYGIELGGTRIWKINGLTGAKDSTSLEGSFTNLQSITSNGSGILFVLDKSGVGKVHRVATSDLNTKQITYTMPNTYPGPSGSQYSDIEYTATNNILWIAAHYDSRHNTSATSSDQLLWKFTVATSGGSSSAPTLTNMMPRMSGGSVTTVGTWVETVDGDADGVVDENEFAVSSNTIQETFPRSLLKHGNDAAGIYWLARYQNSGDDGSADYGVRWVHRSITGQMSGSSNFDKIASVTSCRTLVLHRIKNDHSCDTNNGGNTNFVPMYNVYHPAGANGSVSSPGSGAATFSPVNIDSIGIDNTYGEVYLTIGDVLQKCSTDIDTSWVTHDTGNNNNNRKSLVSENAVGPTSETSYTMTPSGQTARTGVKINFGYVPSSAAVGSSYSADGTNMVLLRQSGTAGFDKIAKTFSNNTAMTYFNDHSLIGITVSNESSTTSELQSGYSYFYRISIIFDGYQETPLSKEIVLDANSNTENNSLALSINDKTQISDRASAINIYRAEHTSSSATAPASVYRLVKTLPLSSGWAENGDVGMTQTITDTGFKGASYEAESGLPEIIEDTLPQYSLSTQLNNQHYIGKCYHEGHIDDATSYIFVSKVGKFDVFDWVLDFIKLPTVPTALISFSGRVFAFDENNTYRIRGGNELFIEDIFEGVGCLNDDAVVSTDFGLFFADNNNIYQHNGQSASPIGESIVRGDSTYSWQNRDQTYHTRAMYDAKRRSVYFTFKTGSDYFAWAYNIPRGRWDLLSIGDTGDSTQPKGFYLLNDNSINISNGTSIFQYLKQNTLNFTDATCDTTNNDATITMDSTTNVKAGMYVYGTGIPTDARVLSVTNSTTFELTANATASNTNTTLTFSAKRKWTWVSKDLTMGNDTQQKSIKRILLPTRIKANYTTNSSKPSIGSQVSNTQVRGTYRMNVNQKATNLKVRLDSNSAGDECGAVGVLFRTKRSPR